MISNVIDPKMKKAGRAARLSSIQWPGLKGPSRL
jgi:hypothetical protein